MEIKELDKNGKINAGKFRNKQQPRGETERSPSCAMCVRAAGLKREPPAGQGPAGVDALGDSEHHIQGERGLEEVPVVGPGLAIRGWEGDERTRTDRGTCWYATATTADSGGARWREDGVCGGGLGRQRCHEGSDLGGAVGGVQVKHAGAGLAEGRLEDVGGKRPKDQLGGRWCLAWDGRSARRGMPSTLCGNIHVLSVARKQRRCH